MRAFVVREFGKPGRVDRVDDPPVGDGELRVRIHVASYNAFDQTVVSGGTRSWADTRLPLVPGIDGAGTIETVGPGVEGFAPGDPVVVNAGTKGWWGGGTYAELVVVPSGAATRKPDAIDDEAAATVSLAGLTGLAGVDLVDPRPGQVVVVAGSTGGVGSWFTQLTALRGARIVALSRPENADYARSLGASDVIDQGAGDPMRTVRTLFPSGVDAVVDFSGSAEVIDSLAETVREGGLVATSATRLDADAFARRGLRAAQINRADLERTPELLELLAERGIRPPAILVIPLDRVSELFDGRLKSSRGKVVIRIG